MKIEIALIEDSKAARDTLEEFMSEKNDVSELFRLSTLCTESVTEENSAALIASFKQHQGPLILILDMELYANNSNAHTLAIMAYQRVSGVIRSRLPELSVGDANDVSELLDRLDANVGDSTFRLDGLEFGFAAVENTKIEPLVIWVATHATELGVQLSHLLRCYGRLVGRSSSELDAFGRGSMNSLRKPVLAERLKMAWDRFERLNRLSDPWGRLEAWLGNGLTFHPQQKDLEELKGATRTLLGLAGQEFEMDLWPSFSKHAVEMAKRSGTGGRPYLGAVAAWSFALLAYLHADGGRPWKQIFDPSELEKLDERAAKYPITPTLSAKSAEEGSLRKAVVRYFSMCHHLFQAGQHGSNEAGPLRKVSLTDRELSFRLAFSPWKTEGEETKDLTKGGLLEKMGRWRDAYLRNQEGLPQRWSDDPSQCKNRTSRAMLDWLLTCVMNDPVFCKSDSNLQGEKFWKMRLRIPAGHNDEIEVVFSD